MPKAVKLSDELVESAREESRVWSRSMTQQIEHWARIGRAVERSKDVSHDRIGAALRAELEYDALEGDEQRVLLGEIERAVTTPSGEPDFAAELRARKEPVTHIENGQLVWTDRSGRSHPITDVDDWAARTRNRAGE